jgi:hypothetical protein
MLSLTVVLYIIGQKDVLSIRTFCPAGRFVSMDVLSLRTLCPYGRFVSRMLCLRLFCLWTFCLRMFCPYGRFVSGRFVWAPVWTCMYIYTYFHTYMDILVYAYMYIYLYVVKILFRFVSPNFLTKFRRNETKHGLGKTKFREILFRDETEKV